MQAQQWREPFEVAVPIASELAEFAPARARGCSRTLPHRCLTPCGARRGRAPLKVSDTSSKCGAVGGHSRTPTQARIDLDPAAAQPSLRGTLLNTRASL